MARQQQHHSLHCLEAGQHPQPKRRCQPVTPLLVLCCQPGQDQKEAPGWQAVLLMTRRLQLELLHCCQANLQPAGLHQETQQGRFLVGPESPTACIIIQARQVSSSNHKSAMFEPHVRVGSSGIPGLLHKRNISNSLQDVPLKYHQGRVSTCWGLATSLASTCVSSGPGASPPASVFLQTVSDQVAMLILVTWLPM